MNDLMLGQQLLYTAQLAALYDTGNLAFNSIIIARQPNGWRLTSMSNVASYGEVLERGRRDRALVGKERDAVGWWSNGVRGAVTKVIDSTYNFDMSSDTVNYETLARKSRDNPARNNRYLRELAR